MDPKLGKIHPSKTLFLRSAVGEAMRGAALRYELANNSDGTPLIRSDATGKWFSLSWEDIITLAERAGIDAEEDAKE